MVLDSRIQAVREAYQVWTFADWQNVSPADVLQIPNVGPVTLDHIRLYLAQHDVALRDDRTPEFWRQHIKQARIASQIAGTDESVVCPFVVLVDSAEQEPFEFKGLKCGIQGKDNRKPLLVKTQWQSLGRHPNQLGDYSIEGYVGRVHVERKSIDDCQQTILGFDGARDRFERELHNLTHIEAPLIVVEGSLTQVIGETNGRRKTKPSVQSRQLLRSIVAFQQDYAVPWMFCDSRRMAEIVTFRFFERYWRKKQQEAKQRAKMESEQAEVATQRQPKERPGPQPQPQRQQPQPQQQQQQEVDNSVPF